MLVAVLASGCAGKDPPPAPPGRRIEQTPSPSRAEPATAKTSPSIVGKANVGRRISVTGWAQNRKNGAVLVGDDFELWIDDLHGWPTHLYSGGERGAKLVVTGTLDEDHGLPVFIQRPGDPVPQGIPVPRRHRPTRGEPSLHLARGDVAHGE
jgi:hypothetical protein